MDKLKKKYDKRPEKKVSPLMILDNKTERKTLDSHIEEHFEHVGSFNNGHVKGFLDIKETSKGLEADVLIVYADGTGKSFYLESSLSEEEARKVLQPLEKGEEIHIYAKGKDYIELIKKIKERLPLTESKKPAKRKYSKEIRRSGDHYIVDVKVLLDYGVHARPAADMINTEDEYGSVVQLKNDKTGREGNTKSIISLLLLGATKDTSLTLRSDNKEALKAVYDILTSPEKYAEK